MAAKKQQLVQRYTRPGEGVAIASVRQDIVESGGGVSHGFSVDLSTAQVPDRRYAAEVGAIVMSDNMIRLLFGQTKAIGEGLSSLLVIHMSFRGARVFLHSMNGSVAKTAQDYMARHNVRKSTLFELKDQKEPAQTATVEANIVAAGYSGREACMDFYHSSSFAMHGFGVTGKFFAEPTVRVTLALPLLMAIHDWLLSHKSELPADELEDHL